MIVKNFAEAKGVIKAQAQKAQAQPGASAAAKPDNKVLLPTYLPIAPRKLDQVGSNGKTTQENWAKGKYPVFPVHLSTRSAVMNNGLDETLKNGEFAGVYKGYFLAFAAFFAMIASAFIHPYLAALFAYLSAHFWSEKEFNSAWGTTWYQGKTVIFTP
jgi:hypothetical protein